MSNDDRNALGLSGPTYAAGVRSGVKRAAAWLREHGEDNAFWDWTSDDHMAPSAAKLADALDRMADEGEGA
jgi:hypothetical protein